MLQGHAPCLLPCKGRGPGRTASPGGCVFSNFQSSKVLGRRSRNRCVRIEAVAAPAGGEVPFTAWDTAIQRVAKRTDLKTIMLLGAGPIVIGQVRWDDSMLLGVWFEFGGCAVLP
jgi:hypothetical protein